MFYFVCDANYIQITFVSVLNFAKINFIQRTCCYSKANTGRRLLTLYNAHIMAACLPAGMSRYQVELSLKSLLCHQAIKQNCLLFVFFRKPLMSCFSTE